MSKKYLIIEFDESINDFEIDDFILYMEQQPLITSIKKEEKKCNNCGEKHCHA